MEKEIYHREYDVKKYKALANIEQYNLKKIVENIENLMLQKKNPYIDNPTCEIEFAEKWVNLYEFLIKNDCNKRR